MAADQGLIHLDVSVHVPGGLLAVVDRLHRGVGQAGDVPARKHPGLAGLHGVGADVRGSPAVQLHRGQGLRHWREEKEGRSVQRQEVIHWVVFEAS